MWIESGWGWRGDEYVDTYHFYLGERLVESITVGRELVKKFVEHGTQTMGFIWNLFKLAQGEKKVLKVQERNSKEAACFEIRYIPTEKEKWRAGLTIRDLENAVIEGQRKFV